MTGFEREKDMKSIVADWLRAQGLVVRGCETYSPGGYPDLVACSLDAGMVERRERRQKSWRPLHIRLVAVELKLTRVAQALRQARAYQAHFEEVFVAFPAEIAARVVERATDGIGVLSVRNQGCEVLVGANPTAGRRTGVWGIENQVEKFWRERKALAIMSQIGPRPPQPEAQGRLIP